MSFINYAAKELNCKVVYAGLPFSGKSTNLRSIYERTEAGAKGKMISLETESDRTLFFDFLPTGLPTVRGFTVRVHLYTVPGVVNYDANRKVILKGADGIVFVADSSRERFEANREELDNLGKNLAEHGLDIAKIPLVIQYNKRDLPDAVPVEELRAALNPWNAPEVEAKAAVGEGVFPTLKAVFKPLLPRLK